MAAPKTTPKIMLGNNEARLFDINLFLAEKRLFHEGFVFCKGIVFRGRGGTGDLFDGNDAVLFQAEMNAEDLRALRFDQNRLPPGAENFHLQMLEVEMKALRRRGDVLREKAEA